MRGFLLLSVVVLAAGCSPLAPSSVYRPFTTFSVAGYRDKQISEGEWEVTYKTDITDRHNFADRYARYRAAELAREAGFPFFQIIREEGTRTIGGSSSSTVELTVRGARSRDEQLMCEGKPMYLATPHRGPCDMYSTEEALVRFAPMKRPGRQRTADSVAVPE